MEGALTKHHAAVSSESTSPKEDELKSTSTIQ